MSSTTGSESTHHATALQDGHMPAEAVPERNVDEANLSGSAVLSEPPQSVETPRAQPVDVFGPTVIESGIDDGIVDGDSDVPPPPQRHMNTDVEELDLPPRSHDLRGDDDRNHGDDHNKDNLLNQGDYRSHVDEPNQSECHNQDGNTNQGDDASPGDYQLSATLRVHPLRLVPETAWRVKVRRILFPVVHRESLQVKDDLSAEEAAEAASQPRFGDWFENAMLVVLTIDLIVLPSFDRTGELPSCEAAQRCDKRAGVPRCLS